MSGRTIIARRILLRLEPGAARDGGLAAAARMARAFHAELAARLILDTRLAGAVTIPVASTRATARESSSSQSVIARRAEIAFRQTISTLAEREQATWSFAVVECAGFLSKGDAVEPDDLVAIELPRLEVALGDLRREVEGALARARGVVLFPSGLASNEGPIVAIVRGGKASGSLVEQAERIAAALDAPLLPLAPTAERTDARTFAAAVRQRRAALAVIAADDPIAREFLARTRFLRELGAPLLLLKSTA